MGWWNVEDGIDLLGDGPADILSAAMREIERRNGRRPTLQEFLDGMRRALEVNPGALLLDGNVQVSALTARLNDGGKVSTTGTGAPDGSVVKIIYQALEDIVTAYEDMEDHRKPRLSELLATAAFIMGPDDQNFVDTPSGSGVDAITATIERS
jgi:hypothetical protein